MKSIMRFLALLGAIVLFSSAGTQAPAQETLVSVFDHPPVSARPSCFWWWFNSLVDKEGITRDLEEFKAKGMGGVTLVCTGNDYGVAEMPRGPVFLSPEWFELYRFALDEAARLGLEVGVNFGGGGWCIGGAWIVPELNARWFVQSDTTISGPRLFSGRLPSPDPRDGYKPPHYGNVSHYMTWPVDRMDYRTSAIVAFRIPDQNRSRLDTTRARLLDAKSNRRDAPIDISPADVMGTALREWKSDKRDKPIAVSDVIDLTGNLKSDGTLEWQVPEGRWEVITTGHVATGADVRCVLPEVGYALEIDWLNPAAMDIQFKNLGELLLKNAGPNAGKTLKYFHSDSFEDGYPNWTDNLSRKFKEYRGYDPIPYLPVFRGWIVGSAEISDRFLYDYRKTVADCFADGSYGRLADLAHQRGMLLQSEAAGPSWSGTVCFDALKNLGRCDNPMGEFWVDSWPDALKRNKQNYVGKQTATASHVYGRRTASAEAFTGMAHWAESPGLLKRYADLAFCEGINRFVFHTMTSTRPRDGLPGYEYGAGTHFNPNVTWWQQAAGPWLSYINRCQAMLQSGKFVADVLYYDGDWAPNLVDVKHVDPSLGKGYDYDVCNAEVLLSRVSVKHGLLTLPDGMAYHVLVLPEAKAMPAEVARKVKDLVEAGAVVIGPKPEKDPGLRDYPRSDEEVRRIASYLWGDERSPAIDRKVGRGRVVFGKTVREVLRSIGVGPDVEFSSPDTSTFIDFVHRKTAEAEVYFLANRNDRDENFTAAFRVQARTPELWDAVTGERRSLPQYEVRDGRTIIPLHCEPYGSMFIVFPRHPSRGLAKQARNDVSAKPFREIAGPWEVRFNRDWFYPVKGLTGEQAEGKFTFASLEDWSKHKEEAVRYFSGTASYRTTFEMQREVLESNKRLFVDLGKVHGTAKVRLNGKELQVLWCSPWRVEVTTALKAGENVLEIEVVNLWPNRLIGDAGLPEGERKTRTNVISFKKDSPLLPSGLLGPVRLVAELYLSSP